MGICVCKAFRHYILDNTHGKSEMKKSLFDIVYLWFTATKIDHNVG